MSDIDEEEAKKAAAKEARIDAAIAVLRILEDEERLEAMSEFCRGCGWEGHGCQCQNDE